MFWFVWFQTTINNLWSSVSRSDDHDDHVGGSCPSETSNVPWVLTCCHHLWLLNTLLVSLAAQCELVQYLFNLMRQNFGGIFVFFLCKCVRTHGRLLALFKWHCFDDRFGEVQQQQVVTLRCHRNRFHTRRENHTTHSGLIQTLQKRKDSTHETERLYKFLLLLVLTL